MQIFNKGCLSSPGGGWEDSTGAQSLAKRGARGCGSPIIHTFPSLAFLVRSRKQRGAWSLLWEMNKSQCQVNLNLGFNPNKILLWKATSRSCYFLVVHSRTALIMLKPNWPLALNGERSREKAGKILLLLLLLLSHVSRVRLCATPVEAKSLVAHGLFFTLPLLSTAFLVTWSY